MRSAMITISYVALVATGCSQAPSESLTAPGTPAFTNSASVKLASVSLVVTVSDVGGTGTAYKIQSDGGGAYTDGTQNVQAVLDQYGTFAFNTPANTRLAQVRSLKYNFDSPVDPANTYRPALSSTGLYHISTGPSSFSPFIHIQNLGINGNPTSECGYMGNSVGNSTQTWRVSFHKGNEDVATSPTAFAVFTRTSVSPAVWTVTPVGSCSPNSNVAALRSEDGTYLYGYYNLPFFFTLSAR